MSLPRWTSLSLDTRTHTQDKWKPNILTFQVSYYRYTHSYSHGEWPGIYFIRRSSRIFPDLVTDLIVGEQTLGTHLWHLAFFSRHSVESGTHQSHMEGLENHSSIKSLTWHDEEVHYKCNIRLTVRQLLWAPCKG